MAISPSPRGALCGHWHPMKPQPHPASNLPVCHHDCHQNDNMNKKLCVMHSCTQDETRIDYLRCSTCLLFDFHNFSSCFMSSLTTPEALRANKKSQKSFIYMILRDFHMIFYETPISSSRVILQLSVEDPHDIRTKLFDWVYWSHLIP